MTNPNMKKTPKKGVNKESNRLTLYRRSKNGVFFPVKEFDLDFDCGGEWADQFELRLSYTGHMIQLKVEPSLPGSLTPQESSPEQETNRLTGGSPALTASKDVETLTILFATKQS